MKWPVLEALEAYRYWWHGGVRFKVFRDYLYIRNRLDQVVRTIHLTHRSL